MAKWRLKGCPRCRGDIFVEKDMDGWYEQCLQCAYRRELRKLAEFNGPAVPAGTAGSKK